MVLTSVYLNFIICLLLWVYQWRQNKAIIYLVSLILLANMRHVIILLLNQPIESRVLAVLLIHFDPVIILIGPLLFLYFKSLIQGKLVFEKWFWLYLIPCSIIFINTFSYYFLDFEAKVQFAKLMQHNNHADIKLPSGTWLFDYDIQMIIAPLHNWTFIGYTFIYLYQQKKKNSIRTKVSRIIVRVLWIILLMMSPVLLQILFATLKSPHSFDLSFQDSTVSSDIMYLSTLLLPLSFFLFPSWLYGPGSSSSILEKLKEIWYTITRVSSDGLSAKPEKSADLDRIIEYMEMKKPYLNPNFSIHDVSRELNIPHLRVSTSFNKQLETSFPEYRNKLRVAYAVNLLQENAHFQMSIEGIAFQSGFKNKSSFYTAFRAVHQMTPTEWISKHLG
jgi:AraC-like DNA-binding protein